VYRNDCHDSGSDSQYPTILSLIFEKNILQIPALFDSGSECIFTPIQTNNTVRDQIYQSFLH